MELEAFLLLEGSHWGEPPYQDRSSWLGKLGIMIFPVILSFWRLRYDPDVVGTIAGAVAVYAYLIVFLAAENIVQFGSPGTTEPGYAYYVPVVKLIAAIFLWFLMFDIAVRSSNPAWLAGLAIAVIALSVLIFKENLRGFAATYREEMRRNEKRQLARLARNPRRFRKNGRDVDIRGRGED